MLEKELIQWIEDGEAAAFRQRRRGERDASAAPLAIDHERTVDFRPRGPEGVEPTTRSPVGTPETLRVEEQVVFADPRQGFLVNGQSDVRGAAAPERAPVRR